MNVSRESFLWTAMIIVFTLLGCGSNSPAIQEHAVTTGKLYTENKVLFSQKIISFFREL